MIARTYQLRIFLAGDQKYATTCLYEDMSEPKIRYIVEEVSSGQWLTQSIERKQNSGDFSPPPSDGEVWVTVVPKTASGAKT
jgi:hypothetical protein